MNTNPRLDWAFDWLKGEKRLYIGGEWVQASQRATFVSTNPANQNSLATLSEASRSDIDSAVSQARSAFRGSWPKQDRRERARILRKIGELVRTHKEELATLEALDNGKTYREALYDDLPDSADVFDYYAGWTDKLYGESCPVEDGFVNFTQHEPLGVCALIVPWNFPLLLAAWKIAPALAMGNTVVIKPSPFTSLSLVRLAQLIDGSKLLPPGVFNLVLGGVEAGEALSSHPDIDKISFTGSTAIGAQIVQASGRSNLKSVSLELGGKAPNIIFDDVKDLPAVIDRSFNLMFSQKGEKCTEPTRFFLHEKIYDQFSAGLIEKAKAAICGDPFDPVTTQGAQCHKAHFEKILAYIEIGKKEGAQLLVGGNRDSASGNEKGFFVRPTIFGNVQNKMQIARDEIFGPVLCLLKFSDEEQVIAEANDTPYGLAAGVYSDDAKRAMRVAQKLDAGMVFVNHYGCYHFSSPFGGIKQSGWGHEMARHSLESYTRLKSIWVKY